MERNRDSRMGRDVAMDSATEAEGKVLLQDDPAREGLARFCLERGAAETKQALAWVNAICLAYLVIGLMGLKPPPIYVVKRSMTEEAVPTAIEPLISTVQQITPDSAAEETPSEQTPGRREDGPKRRPGWRRAYRRILQSPAAPAPSSS